MLRERLVAAAAILGPLLLLLWLDHRANFGMPGLWLVPTACIVTFLVASELAHLCQASSAAPRSVPAVAGALLLVVATSAPYLAAKWLPEDCPLGHWGWTVLGLAAATLIAFLWEMATFRQGAQVFGHLAATVLVIVYVGLGMSFLAALRLAFARDGLFALVTTLMVTKVADAGAYFVGRKFGRHPLAPRLSPKKTIEGGVGGLLAAVVCAVLMLTLVRPYWIGTSSRAVHWAAQLALGGALFLAGLVGDLAESLIKRDLDCKDSSHWLPGLGGLLDVLDSVLFAAPVGYLFWAAGWMG